MASTRDNFVRLAEQRTRRAIKDIRLIGNLSNRSNYSYVEADIDKIFKTLDREIKAARKRFDEAPKTSKDIKFSLE